MKDKTKVNFLRSADAFLYLPIYIARNLGLYKEIDPFLEVEFDHPINNGGDLQALREMVRESNEGESIPIAVCDPFAMFLGGESLGKLENLRVLGAFITKVPFWAIDGPKTKWVEKEEELKGSFKKLIYYNDNLQTGNYIGKQTMVNAEIWDAISVDFGREFSTLLSQPTGESIAITCDILGMAIHKKQNQIGVAHCFAQNEDYKNFITTALITTADVCKEHTEAIVNVLQGMQNALAILRTSKEVAFKVCTEISPDPRLFQEHHLDENGKIPELEPSQIKNMVEWIYNGDFYPKTLDISKTQWEKTIDSHSKIFGLSKMLPLFEEGKNLYEKIVVNKHLLEAQKRFISHVGINYDAIIKEALEFQKIEIEKNFEQTRKELEDKINKLEGKEISSPNEHSNEVIEERLKIKIRVASTIAEMFSWIICTCIALVFCVGVYYSLEPISNRWTWLEPFISVLSIAIPLLILFFQIRVEKYIHLQPRISNKVLKLLLKSKKFFTDLGIIDETIVNYIIGLPHKERKQFQLKTFLDSKKDANKGE